jgi:hypothetical protein
MTNDYWGPPPAPARRRRAAADGSGATSTAPRWLVVRNGSDPPINGSLPTSPTVPDMQSHWAVFCYAQYGY